MEKMKEDFDKEIKEQEKKMKAAMEKGETQMNLESILRQWSNNANNFRHRSCERRG